MSEKIYYVHSKEVWEKLMKQFPGNDYIKHIAEKDKYILDENKNVIPADLREWSLFFEKNREKLIVKQEVINEKLIHTAFLGLNLKLGGEHLHIFETNVYEEAELDEIYNDGCSTWNEAEKMHEKAVEWVKNGCKNPRVVKNSCEENK